MIDSLWSSSVQQFASLIWHFICLWYRKCQLRKHLLTVWWSRVFLPTFCDSMTWSNSQADSLIIFLFCIIGLDCATILVRKRDNNQKFYIINNKCDQDLIWYFSCLSDLNRKNFVEEVEQVSPDLIWSILWVRIVWFLISTQNYIYS